MCKSYKTIQTFILKKYFNKLKINIFYRKEFGHILPYLVGNLPISAYERINDYIFCIRFIKKKENTAKGLFLTSFSLFDI